MLSVQQEELLLSLLLLAVCPQGFFGKRCEEQCDCVHGLSCHHQTGACRCEKGWRGRHCDKRECLLGVHGGKFRSARTFLPDPELMTGSFRARVAPWGRSGGAHGDGCSRIRWRGVALHYPAWPLPHTLTRIGCTVAACLPGRYGAGCAQRCRCPAGTPCHHLTGECGCPPGFTGYGCEKSKFVIRMQILPL